MTIELVRELFQDADLLGYIRAGALSGAYDKAADKVFNKLSPDLSVDQIARIIWTTFYHDFLTGTIGNSNEYFGVGKNAAVNIIGEASRFAGVAKTIRQVLYKL